MYLSLKLDPIFSRINRKLSNQIVGFVTIWRFYEFVSFFSTFHHSEFKRNFFIMSSITC
jgi:hypothetical protein